MIVGYARVSSREQNLDRQLQELKHAKCSKIYQEKQSGKDTDREQLQLMLQEIKQGDLILVKSLDRLSRDYRDCESIFKTIKDKGAYIKILDMPILDTSKANNDLLDAFIFDIVFKVLSYVSQTEREKIKQRQREGIAIARAKGAYKGIVGRKAAMTKDEFVTLTDKVKLGLLSAKAAAKAAGITSTSYYRLKKKYNID